MSVITLDDAKKHMRILHDHENDLIESLIPVALMHVSDEIDRPLDDPVCLVDGQLKPTLRLAALMIVADLYQNREAQQDVDLKPNATVARLLKSSTRLGV